MFKSMFAIPIGIGVWTGLLRGLFEDGGHWGTSEIWFGVALGALAALQGWFSPSPPADGVGELWDTFTRKERRAVVRALSRGEALEPPSLARRAVPIAERAGEEQARRIWDTAAQVVSIAATGALLILAERRGAPAGWLVAATVATALLFAVGSFGAEPARQRARRAAEANRRAGAVANSVRC